MSLIGTKTNLIPQNSLRIIMKLSKPKTKNDLSKQQIISYKGTPVRLLTHFSVETLKVKRGWDDIFKKMLKLKDLPITNTSPSKAVLQMK